MKHIALFELIAPIYALFYSRQIRAYQKVLPKILSMNNESKVIDIACGTGGLTAVLAQHFTHVLALDGAANMIKEAKKIHVNSSIEFNHLNVLEGLPYANQSFDLITTSFFLHGINSQDRLVILKEMKRVSKRVLIVDYYGKSNFFIDLVEYFEGGDYFNFKKTFVNEISDIFDTVEIIPLHKSVAMYTNY